MQVPTGNTYTKFAWRRAPAEFGGACGDLGTFLPHVIGAVTVGGLAPAGVLAGFGAFFIASGLFYGIPMAVQPMKAISAVLVTGQAGPAEIAAAVLLIGAVLVLLGLTGTITWIARVIPQSVSAGLQLGLGLSMVILGVEFMARTPWIGASALVLLVAFLLVKRIPAALLMITIAIAGGIATGLVTSPSMAVAWSGTLPWVIPTVTDVWHAVETLVIPQLPLTLTNAVIVTALVVRDLYPHAAPRASERNIALSSGIANMLLAPLGAMPMCHGAGGVQAQHRFGARTGLAPILMGGLLLVLGFGFSGGAAALLAAIPIAAVGALLLIAGTDLAISRRLFDAQPSCWPVIALTAAGTLFADPAVGLIAGCASEIIRKAVIQAIARRSRVG